MIGIDSANKTFWDEAINKRRSCRSFEMRAVTDQTMSKLKDFTGNIPAPFSHDVEIRFFTAEAGRALSNNLRNPPPDGMGFIAGTDLLSVAKTGFVGELAILYATGLGLSTCWYGHYLLPEVERIMPHLGEYKNDPHPHYGYAKGEVEGKRAICITPIGYWEQKGARLIDRMTMNLMSFKRKPLVELMENNQNPETLLDHLRYALDLARKAPSGANSQHWRFSVSDDCKTVTIAKPVGYQHIKWEHCEVDVGICACHFWIGLQIQGIKCELDAEENQDRIMWKFKL